MKDEGEVRLFFTHAFYLCDTLESLAAVNAAANAVNSVGREYYHSVIVKTFENHLDMARVRVLRVYLQQHKFSFFNYQHICDFWKSPICLHSE